MLDIKNIALQKTEDILKQLDTDAEKGLSSQQVSMRLHENGENTLKEKKRKSAFKRFLEQFKDVMIIILLLAAAVSFIVALNGSDSKEFFEPALILLIVIVNAIIGLVQENKAEKALDALKNLSAQNARVIRNGKEEIVNSKFLVVGDIIKLEAGDFVPADARLIDSTSLKSEESALTGESVPSEKDYRDIAIKEASIGDKTNMVFSGCSITYGTAKAVIVATGMNTEMGKIANLLDNESENVTPLQKKLTDLGKKLGILALIACAIIFVIGIIDGINVLEIFMTSVSLAVSAIPEGLPAIVTVVLSIGVSRMVKKNAIIRSLPAVETLGSASVICSDKTGTLTQNKMTLTTAYVDGTFTLEKINSNNSSPVKNLLSFATLCSNGSVVASEDGYKHIGDPTETSIVLAATQNGLTKEDLNKRFKRVEEIPFDSDRKLMTTINIINDKKVVIVKGAFDILASKCIKGDIPQAKKINDTMTDKALRVIAVAYKEIDSMPNVITSEALENNLQFMGLLGMIDPPRKEAKEAVDVCKKAGIKPVMITGDHIATASAIARELGILMPTDKAITGAMLDEMSDQELYKEVNNIAVYARVSPENKIRIVKAFKHNGEVVSMTGDGVNDAPALKAADIGCAMGITGTDVAKGASDIILTDDKFSTIVDAIKEGRGIYDNIRKVVAFLLGTNIGEVLTVFFAMLIFRESPLISIQLLLINLVTDSFPAIALGMENVEPDIMTNKPKSKNEGIFSNGLGVRIALQGIMFGILTLLSFYIGITFIGTTSGGQTMAFVTLAISQIIQSYNMRSNRSLFKIGVFSNKKLNLAALLSVLIVLIVVYTPVSIAFGMINLSYIYSLIAFGLALVPLLVMELSKAFGLIKHEERS